MLEGDELGTEVGSPKGIEFGEDVGGGDGWLEGDELGTELG